MINYYLLTKPGIILGNLITVAAGFALASKGLIDFWLFLATLTGLALIMASACVFNNYIDRKIDQKMARTKNRALVKGLISGRNAIFFATLLGLLGNLVLLLFTNLLTVSVANLGFFVYVVLYSMWKCRTIYGTAIGSVAGAVPPVVGYCSVSNHFDAGALILFVMMVLWQMPHFFAIAIYHLEDYSAASMPVFPVKKGVPQAARRMILYIVGFMIATVMLTLCDYTGYLYLTIGALFGSAWLWLCLKGLKNSNYQLWARNMFRLSLVIITAICIVIPFDLVVT
jgi:heme o synthase